MAKRCRNFLHRIHVFRGSIPNFVCYKHNWHYKLIYSYLKRQLLPPAQLNRSRCNLRRIKIFLRRKLARHELKMFWLFFGSVFSDSGRFCEVTFCRMFPGCRKKTVVESTSAVYCVRIQAVNQIYFFLLL